MKNVFVFLFVGLLIMSCGTTKEMEEVVEEEERTSTFKEPRPQTLNRGPKRGGVDAEQLAAQLGLSVEQEGPFIEMWDRTTKAMQQVRIEKRGDRDALIEGMGAVKAERQAGLEKILTQEQMYKYYEIMQVNRGKVRGTLHKRKG